MAEDNFLTVSLTAKDKERIFSKISIDPETGCWNWTGYVGQNRYGYVYFHGRPEMVHRLMYAYKKHSIPKYKNHAFKSLQIDHLCRNKQCCNPDHLELVTHEENQLRAKKTFCKRGHLLPEEDEYGHRECKECKAINMARYKSTLVGEKREHHLKLHRARCKRYYQSKKLR